MVKVFKEKIYLNIYEEKNLLSQETFEVRMTPHNYWRTETRMPAQKRKNKVAQELIDHVKKLLKKRK